MKILITGGAGFVGRNLVSHLEKYYGNTEVWIIDDLSTGIHPEKWPEISVDNIESSGSIQRFKISQNGHVTEIHFIQKDILSILLGELDIVASLVEFQLPKFDRVFHLASIVGGRGKIEGDPLAVGIDLAIDSIFFKWASSMNKPDRVLYASSSAAYPINLQTETESVALKESMIDFTDGFAAPDFTYGWSKLTGEYLSKIAHEKYGMNVAIVRPFSGYGEYQEPVYPVPAIAMRAAAGIDPLYVWGTGEQTRDFVHIEDCIRCMYLAIEKIDDARGVNIGSGKATSFLELAALFAKIKGYNPKIEGLSGKPIGVSHRYCDPQYTKDTLDFYPEISLEEGMTRVVKVAELRVAAGMDIPK